MALNGIERLMAARMARQVKVVAARVAGLQDVVFRRQEPVAFFYDGQLRKGTVRRIDTEGVLVRDDDREDLRMFKYDKVEGGPPG